MDILDDPGSPCSLIQEGTTGLAIVSQVFLRDQLGIILGYAKFRAAKTGV